MIDSEIIDGELVGVIEPRSRAHQVLKVVTNQLLLKKLSAPQGTPLVLSSRDIRNSLHGSKLNVSDIELRTLSFYGLIRRGLYMEQWRLTEQGIEPEYDAYTITWALGETTTGILRRLEGGEEVFVSLV